jgi:probable rRNA maturation factor
LSIRIFYEEPGIRLKGWRKLLVVIKSILLEVNRIPGDITFVVTNDKELKSINQEFLEHDYYTDVITFNYNKDDVINGEIYISKDTVAENAREFNVKVQEELKRVIIHGVLHLTGMDDRNEAEREVMHEAENRWLKMVRE